MSELEEQVRDLLRRGRSDQFYSGAAAAIRTPHERFTVHVGTHAYDDDRVTTADSLFDLASVTKTFTATVIVRLIEDGVLDPEAPVAETLQVGSGSGADAITLRHLLNHTAGLPANVYLWRDEPDLPREERLGRVLATPLESRPGQTFRYSCMGYIAAGRLAEIATGKPLPDLVRSYVTEPLGLTRTCFGPVDPAGAVATEDESYAGRGMVRGQVHDELNWYLGGAVGNAGLFSTAGDLLAFAEHFLDRTLLTPSGYALMTTDSLTPEQAQEQGHGQSFGLRVGEKSIMTGAASFGHTGFTGTSWVVDPDRETAVVLLTNRVHPSRNRVALNPFRLELSRLVTAHA